MLNKIKKFDRIRFPLKGIRYISCSSCPLPKSHLAEGQCLKTGGETIYCCYIYDTYSEDIHKEIVCPHLLSLRRISIQWMRSNYKKS